MGEIAGLVAAIGAAVASLAWLSYRVDRDHRICRKCRVPYEGVMRGGALFMECPRCGRWWY